MPELPDLTVYREALSVRVCGQTLDHVLIRNPFVLRTAVPPIGDVEGLQIVAIRRLGKRLILALEREYFLVLHLMIAGRRVRYRGSGFSRMRRCQPSEGAPRHAFALPPLR